MIKNIFKPKCYQEIDMRKLSTQYIGVGCIGEVLRYYPHTIEKKCESCKYLIKKTRVEKNY